jgi:hypothetical protein
LTGDMRALTVRHDTVYRYSKPVRLGEHRMMFRPRESHDLRLVRTRFDVMARSASVSSSLFFGALFSRELSAAPNGWRGLRRLPTRLSEAARRLFRRGECEKTLRAPANMKFADYGTDECFDEMFDEHARPRAAAQPLVHFMETLPDGELLRRQQSAERALLHMEITFNVYGDGAGTEHIFPFDLVPRIVAASEWDYIERGLKQRIHALNLFLDDIYHRQRIVKDGVIPAEIIRSAKSFRPSCVGMSPPRGVWCHITGTDLSATVMVKSMCWRTTCVVRRACRTCSPTVSS